MAVQVIEESIAIQGNFYTWFFFMMIFLSLVLMIFSLSKFKNKRFFWFFVNVVATTFYGFYILRDKTNIETLIDNASNIYIVAQKITLVDKTAIEGFSLLLTLLGVHLFLAFIMWLYDLFIGTTESVEGKKKPEETAKEFLWHKR